MIKNCDETVYGSALADIGGQPCAVSFPSSCSFESSDKRYHAVVFTGGTKSEQISAFDARAPGRALYSLATGNNFVQSIAWQAATSTLWAATECMYVDRMG